MSNTLFPAGLPVLNFLGSRILIDPSDWIGRSVALEGGYEPRSLSRSLRVMSSGGTFVDVGSNFGLYSICVGMLPECGVSLLMPRLSPSQDSRHTVPSMRARVDIVSSALAETSGVRGFQTPRPGNSGTTRLLSPEAPGSRSAHFWAAGSPLDDVLDALGVESVRLLKIDVEGFETTVLSGLDFRGRHRPENIIVECDLEGFSSAADSFRFISERGYQPMSVDGTVLRECSVVQE